MMRFKFMPTPGSPLHVGHAWLVLLMDRLVAEARACGQDADLVLVLDTLTTHHFGVDQEVVRRISDRISDDLYFLNVDLAAIVRNGQRWGGQEILDKMDAEITIQQRDLLSGLPTSHYLKNAWLDAQLGVTHVVRGADRLPYDRLYRECYTAIGYPAPRMAYLPVLLTDEGEKITADHSPYQLCNVLDAMDARELWKRLLALCVHPAALATLDLLGSITELLAACWLPDTPTVHSAPHNRNTSFLTEPHIVLSRSLQS